MKTATFELIRKIVYDKSGICLGDNKLALVRARIAKRMRALKISDYSHYLDHVIGDESGVEIQLMLDAISTNVTSFYREPAHFDFLNLVVTGWIEKGARQLRFWSAASSTGEEPYTMSIELAEIIENRPVDAKILATDISTKVIRQSLHGCYSEERIAPVPENLRRKYFVRQGTNGNSGYAVGEKLRQMVVFRQFNLASFPYPIQGPLDMIFCRNVMIYFDRKIRGRMVDEFCRILRSGGYLIVGHAESITGMAKGLKCLKPSIYIKE
ncbi:MAG: protein-glutamate O-methyltransferase CheR [Candidatus Zixiibacteriota bacterium]